jgi:hypothetical protein
MYSADVNNLAAARAIRNGTVAAVLWGSVTAIVAIGALFSGIRALPSGRLLRPETLFDAAAILGLAYGLHRHSRVCAFLLLVYTVANSVDLQVTSKTSFGLSIHLIFFYFFAQAAGGTLVLHRSAREGSAAQRAL